MGNECVCVCVGGQAPNVDGVIEEGKKKPKKNIDITLWGIWGRGQASPIKPDVYTSTGLPAVSTPVLRALAGKPGAAKKALAELDKTEPPPATSSLGKRVRVWTKKVKPRVVFVFLVFSPHSFWLLACLFSPFFTLFLFI